MAESKQIQHPEITEPEKETKAQPRRRWRWARRMLLGLMVCLLLFLLDYYAYPYGALPGGASYNHGENGLWLRYTWYFGEHNAVETQQLARHLQERQISSAYFHVRNVTHDGTLNYRKLQEARKLVATLHQSAPGVILYAWAFVGNRAAGGRVDLSNASVRQAMVSEAKWLTETAGFDGIQWDYEISDDGDANFLSLLRETHAALRPGKRLSAATPMWLPGPLQRWGWSDGYIEQVAASCDQIAVMCYDSGFWTPRSYVWLVRQQALHVPQDAARGNPHCRVLLGLPTYGEGFRSHNPRAENLRFALRGVREGLNTQGAEQGSFAGVALFADYTTDDRDWQTYSVLWQDRR